MGKQIVFRAGIRGAALLFGCAAFGAVPAEPSLLEQLRGEMTGMQGQIAASTHKIKKGMVGLGSDAGEPVTPGQACCASHIDLIKQHSQGLVRSIRGLHTYYTSSGDHVALEELGTIYALVRVLNMGTMAFEKASHQERALEALQGMIRPFTDLRSAIERLEACCPIIEEPAVPPQAAADEAPKKKAKGKK